MNHATKDKSWILAAMQMHRDYATLYMHISNRKMHKLASQEAESIDRTERHFEGFVIYLSGHVNL